MRDGHVAYPTTRGGAEPLSGQELAHLAELLDRYLRYRAENTGRRPGPSVDRLRAEITLTAGLVR